MFPLQAVVGGGVQLPVLVPGVGQLGGPAGQTGGPGGQTGGPGGVLTSTAPGVAHLGSMAVAISASAPVSGTSSLTSIPGTSSLGAVTGLHCCTALYCEMNQ